jgi:hypothetical protein
LVLQIIQELKSFKDELYPLGLEAQGLRVEMEGKWIGKISLTFSSLSSSHIRVLAGNFSKEK